MHVNKIVAAVIGLGSVAIVLSGCGGSNGMPINSNGGKATFGASTTVAGSSSSANATVTPEVASSGDPTRTNVPVTTARDGTIYRQEIEVAGEKAVVQVFEPTRLEPGKTYPLVVNGHGWGGMRERTAPAGSMIARFRDAGYYVISLDQRGFGESGGKVRAMDPEYDGRNLIAILDWAEKLPGLRRKTDGNMVVGSYGGSYGGMFQFLLAGADPKQRLRVIAPDIAPHDLAFSFYQNSVPKSTWLAGLLAVADAPPTVNPLNTGAFDPAFAAQNSVDRAARGESSRADPTITESMGQPVLTGMVTPNDVNYFKYHSVSYFCDGVAAPRQQFTLPNAVANAFPALVQPRPFPKIDALISIGMSDTMFNFNNGYHNHQCLKRAGGDVRLLSHQSGHILGASASVVPGAEGADAAYAVVNPPEFQGAGGKTACGSINLGNAVFAWMEEKLQAKRGAIDAVLKTGQDFCMSIADGDAIQLREIKRGGTLFAIETTTPQFTGPAGVVGASQGSAAREKMLAVQTLMTADEDNTLVAGIPTLSLNIASVLPEQALAACATQASGCDPRFFIAIGRQAVGSSNWTLVNGNLTPLRGFGQHSVDMAGISARLKKGEKLGLLVYAYHTQYATSFSRDVFTPAATVGGSVELPMLLKSDVVREGI